MRQSSTFRLSSWARLVALSLLVGFGLLTGTLLSSSMTHAATTLTVTDCSGETGSGRIGTVLGSASAGDTIMFSCSGTIPITSTLTISKNLTIDGSGPGVTLDGGNSVQVLSVNSGVTFALNALTIAHGSAPGSNGSAGGGIITNGTVTITNSTLSGNSASGLSGVGGGIFNLNGGTLTITNSTLSGNSAQAGGGIFNGGTLTITNSTLSGNSASGIGSTGGGITNNRTVTITNSTLSGNSASGLFSMGGGIFTDGTVTIGGSIVAANPGGDCNNHLTDHGYNLESGTSCGFTGTGSKQSTNPMLDPTGLQNNGGPTQTIALLNGSPAIDAGPVAAQCPSTDQRGDPRPDDASEGACDMGAYESNYPPDSDLGLTVPTPITVKATSPQGATVTYTATATDESGDTSMATVSCTLASGSVFPIGTTTVKCTATDSDDTPSSVSQSFTVTVKGASAQVSDLIATVNSFGLPPDIQASFDTQLQAVQADLTNNNTVQACHDLTAFINHAKAQSGKQLTVSQANQLLAAAKQVQAVLGC